MSLPSEITEDDHLKMLFDTFGAIKECRVIKGEGGKPNGEGLVMFSDSRAASQALQAMNGYECMGSKLRVSLAAQTGGVSILSSGGGQVFDIFVPFVSPANGLLRLEQCLDPPGFGQRRD